MYIFCSLQNSLKSWVSANLLVDASLESPMQEQELENVLTLIHQVIMKNGVHRSSVYSEHVGRQQDGKG